MAVRPAKKQLKIVSLDALVVTNLALGENAETSQRPRQNSTHGLESCRQ